MKYYKELQLKDSRTCILRNGTAEDGQAVFEIFNLTHEQTDWLLSYPDENSFDAAQEAEFLQKKTDSADEIEIVAEIDGKIVGTAGIECTFRKYKMQHRAEFGISVDKAYWGLGVGRVLTEAASSARGLPVIRSWNWALSRTTNGQSHYMRVKVSSNSAGTRGGSTRG